jgi:alpha-amylase
MHGQPMQILYASDLVLVFRRGETGIVALNKSGSNQWAEFSTWGLKNPGQYRDLLDDDVMTLQGDKLSLLVPPRTAQMWVAT